jgi:hypothetical protein
MSKARELAQKPNQPTGRKNLIINGAMNVAQRGTSQIGVGYNAGYFDAPDRYIFNNISQAVFDLSQAADAPDGFAYSYKLDCTTADTSLAADHEINLSQRFEGQDFQHIKKGTSDALPMTLSFWVKSGKTGTYIVEIKDTDNTRTISKSYTVNSANTWEKKSVTFVGDTSGALDTDKNLSLFVSWWVSAGSNYNSGTLETSWASQTNANRAVGQVNFADNTSNNWLLTGVQLEVGSVDTEFEHRSYGEELALCQRYYYQWLNTTTADAHGLHVIGMFTSTRGFWGLTTPVAMRATPSITKIGTVSLRTPGLGADGTVNSWSVYTLDEESNQLSIDTAVTGGTANVYRNVTPASSTGGYKLEAEL